MIKLVHGGDIYSAKERIEGEIIDFSANINPLGLPQSVKEALGNAMDAFSHYPDPICRELVKELAESEQVRQEHILCGNGAADLIFRAVWAMRPRSALIAVPTFSEYEQALTACGCKVDYFELKAENGFQLTEELLEHIQPQTDIVFLCNPNNPTGQLTEQKLLERILARCASCGALLVVDECFRDFLDEPMQNSMNGWVESFPNLMILRAFTKHYAMAGLRLGYCLCSNPPLLERMTQCGQPWSVSVPAQIAGLAALQDRDYLERSRELITQERRYLKESFMRLQIPVIGSQANYIFFYLPEIPELQQELEKSGILIRSCDNYRGLERGYYRIAVRTHAENERLVAALEAVLQPPVIEPVAAETVTVTVEPAQQLPEAQVLPPEEEVPSQAHPVEEQQVGENSEGEKPDSAAERTAESIAGQAKEPDCPVPETAPAEVPEPSAEPEDEREMKIPQQDSETPPSAEQKRQYRFLRDRQKKYDWEGEEEA